MNSSPIKRWLLLGGLLAVTILLVVNAPENETDDVVAAISVTKTKFTEKPKIEGQLFNQTLPDRQALDEEPIDMFGYERKKVKQPTVQPTVAIREKPKPTAPTLPFKYIGMLQENGQKKIFLLQNGALHIVTKGEQIDKKYELTAVDDESLTFVYLPLNVTQTMRIEKTP